MKISSAIADRTISGAIAERIKLIYAVGSFVLTKYPASQITVSDGSSIIEGLIKQFASGRFDSAAVADTFSVELYKSISDNGTLSDAKVLAIFRSISDACAVIEAHSIAFARPVSDQSAVSDLASKSAQKSFSDQPSIIDEQSFDVSKYLQDNFAALEQISISVSKFIEDVAATNDSLETALAKALSDSVGVTDDVDGEASIEDDQEMQFFKNISEASSAIDSFVRLVSFIRQFDDQASMTDAHVVYLDKPATSEASVSDASSIALASIASDEASISDEQLLMVGKDSVDQAATDDEETRAFHKFIDEVLGISDEVLLTRKRNVTSDVSAASDNASLLLSRQVEDQSSVSDVIEILKYVLRTFDESTLVSDAGSLRSQGYSDFTYFAEDYVGASRTF